MNEFDTKAAGWDENPIHLERSIAIAMAMSEMIPIKKNMTAIEFGAGTGILSLLLKDALGTITLMDSSAEMLKIAQSKIDRTGMKAMKTLFIDLEKEEYHEKADLIYSQMVFHHVGDIEKIILKFRNLLNPGGYLAIADLYPEDGSFHGEGFTGHPGFDVEKLANTVTSHGFTHVSHRQCFVIKRKTGTGKINEYPVFLLVAKTS